MFKFIVMIGGALYLIRWIYRGIQQQNTSSTAVSIELKACFYCGDLVRVDKAIIVNDQFFCCSDHAKRAI